MNKQCCLFLLSATALFTPSIDAAKSRNALNRKITAEKRRKRDRAQGISKPQVAVAVRMTKKQRAAQRMRDLMNKGPLLTLKEELAKKEACEDARFSRNALRVSPAELKEQQKQLTRFKAALIIKEMEKGKKSGASVSSRKRKK